MAELTVPSLILHVVAAIEIFGVVAILVGGFYTTSRYLCAFRRKLPTAYADYRSGLGRSILLGLELLVAADIIRTVAVEPSYQSLGVLGLIVAIRTFLSWSLEVEINGRWPWQEASKK